ncbi:MAG: hypothetical protein DRZ79_00580 [Candidatus Cloacimonadota bacterium]|nr:MAG: hypothetical protein DRZ79_00580 [Candidatus Cloacimonadota bacterium]
MKKTITLLLFVAYTLSFFAINESAGTKGFQFLKLNFSARAVGMGNAYTALSDDASAVFFNPAGLIQVKSKEIATTYMSYFEGIQSGSLVFVFPKSKTRTLAVFTQYLTANETRELQDEDGNYSGSAGTFGMSDLIIGVSDSRLINNILNIGFNIKYVRESLDDNSASALVFDVSVLHQTAHKNLKVGVALKNIGRQLTYFTNSKYKEGLPTVFDVGFRFHPDRRLFIVFDLIKPLDGDFAGNIGTEYQIHKMFALRAGYKSNATDWRIGGDYEILSGMSFGVGFNWKRYNVDYAIVSYGDLGLVNQISLKYKF